MTSHTSDDGFHEIQLNGKQLVFLFMAATVVSVVIFLCGVLVGRGVRAEQGSVDSAALTDLPIVDGTAATAGATPAGTDPRVAAPPPAVDELSYFNRLEKSQPIVEELKPAPTPKPAAEVARVPQAAPPPPAVTPPATPAPVARREPAPATSPPAPTRAATSTPGPVTAAFVVQIAALNSQGEADAMAKRLSARGYEAYVQPPAKGAPSIFRVRVGNYPTRRDAETVAAKIEKEGQFKPWVAPR